MELGIAFAFRFICLWRELYRKTKERKEGLTTAVVPFVFVWSRPSGHQFFLFYCLEYICSTSQLLLWVQLRRSTSLLNDTTIHVSLPSMAPFNAAKTSEWLPLYLLYLKAYSLKEGNHNALLLPNFEVATLLLTE